jgi:hypothetical protein
MISFGPPFSGMTRSAKRKLIAQFDTNGDGTLNDEEFAAFKAYMRRARTTAAGAPGGYVTWSDPVNGQALTNASSYGRKPSSSVQSALTWDPAKQFDTNRDGVLDAKEKTQMEYYAQRARMQRMRQQIQAGPGGLPWASFDFWTQKH